jgi:hypothetical protein
MVTITVSQSQEEEQKVFVVHQEFVCHYSPYFDAAFNGKFAEGQTQTLELEGIRPYVFEVFINWIYTQTICSPRGGTLDIKWMIHCNQHFSLLPLLDFAVLGPPKSVSSSRLSLFTGNIALTRCSVVGRRKIPCPKSAKPNT